MQKWNPLTKKYLPYNPPAEWKLRTWCDDMKEVVNCAQCGTGLMYGRGYTSLQIHTEYGMGYCVCGACYQKELTEEKIAEGFLK